MIKAVEIKCLRRIGRVTKFDHCGEDIRQILNKSQLGNFENKYLNWYEHIRLDDQEEIVRNITRQGGEEPEEGKVRGKHGWRR